MWWRHSDDVEVCSRTCWVNFNQMYRVCALCVASSFTVKVYRRWTSVRKILFNCRSCSARYVTWNQTCALQKVTVPPFVCGNDAANVRLETNVILRDPGNNQKLLQVQNGTLPSHEHIQSHVAICWGTDVTLKAWHPHLTKHCLCRKWL